MKNITIQFASLISTFLPYEKSKNITSFLKKSVGSNSFTAVVFRAGFRTGAEMTDTLSHPKLPQIKNPMY